jgi:hypothetical protein
MLALLHLLIETGGLEVPSSREPLELRFHPYSPKIGCCGHNIDRNPMEPFGSRLGFPTRLQPYERHSTHRVEEFVLLDGRGR